MTIPVPMLMVNKEAHQKQNKDSRPAAIPYSKAAIEKLSSNKVLLLQFLIRFL